MSTDAVWIAENQDPQDFPGEPDYLIHWSGLFSASYQSTTVEDALVAIGDGLDDVPVSEAISWARARSDTVYVQVGEVVYTAGALRDPELPEWQEHTLVSARTETLEHEPWLDRTDLDDSIDWDVGVAPSAPPVTDDPSFQEVFARLLVEAGVPLIENPRDVGFLSNVAVRVSARTQAGAREAATAVILPVLGLALREITDASTGWVLGLEARPANSAKSPVPRCRGR